MSATIQHQYTAPGVQNPSPWQRALAQDTGGGWDYTPNSLPGSVDYGGKGLPGMPPYSGGGTGGPTIFDAPPGYQPPGGPPGGTFGQGSTSPYGYSYSNPGAGFNPWGLYDDNGPYKGGDGVGLYNVNADTAKNWGPNGQTETDRDRVWRMTLGDLKARGLDPGSADPATVQAAFLNNVARLHRDYDKTYGPQAWAGSAFSGYDKLNGTGVGAGQQPLVNDPLGGQAQTQGGDGMGLGSGLVQGAQAAGQAVANAGRAAGQSAQTILGGGTYPPTSTQGGGAAYGNMGTNPLYNYGLAQNGTDADRTRMIAEATGRTGPAHGRLAQFHDQLYAQALKAYIMLSQLGQTPGANGATPTGPQDLNSFLAAMQGGGGGMIDLLQNTIGRSLGGNLGTDNATQEQAYRAALALRSLYSGGLASDIGGNELDNALWQVGAQNDKTGGVADPMLTDILNGTGGQTGGGYGAALKQYLGLR